MLFFLFVILLISFFVLYYTRKGDFLYPSVLTSAIFSVGTFIACIGNFGWKVNVSSNSTLIIILGLFCIYLGEEIVYRGTSEHKYHKTKKLFIIPSKIVFFIFLFSVFIAYQYYQKMKYFAALSVLSMKQDTMFLQAVRDYRFYERESLGATLSIPVNFVITISYILSFVFLNNTIILGFKQAFSYYKRYLLNIIPLGIILGLSGARIGFLQYIIFMIIGFLVLSKYYEKRIHLSFKLLRYIIFAICLFLVVFNYLGRLTGKITDGNFYEKYLIYGGSSIIDLDILLNDNHFIDSDRNYIGRFTFSGIYEQIGRFVNFKTIDMKCDDFVYFSNGSGSNIYSAYAFYYEDWGILGIIFINLMVGIIMTWFYRNLFTWKNVFFVMIIFSYIGYGLIGNLFAAELTRSVLGTMQIQFVFWTYIIISLFWRFKYVRKYYDMRRNCII